MGKSDGFRGVRISEGLATGIEKWLKTKKAKELGIHTLAGAVDYACKRLVDK